QRKGKEGQKEKTERTPTPSFPSAAWERTSQPPWERTGAELCLGTHGAKLCLARGAKRSFAPVRSRAELGNEGVGCSFYPLLRCGLSAPPSWCGRQTTRCGVVSRPHHDGPKGSSCGERETYGPSRWAGREARTQRVATTGSISFLSFLSVFLPSVPSVTL